MVGLKRIIAPDWIFSPGSAPLEDGALLLEGDRLLEKGPLDRITPLAPDIPVERLEEAALLPGLINGHTHLELASLARIPAENGFAVWVRELLDHKNRLTDEAVIEGAKEAAKTMHDTGTAYAADLVSSLRPLSYGPLKTVVFREYLGLAPEGLTAFEEEMDRFSLDGPLPACHAAYSTSKALIQGVARWSAAHGSPTTIHLLETPEETDYFLRGKGPILSLLRDRGIDEAHHPETGRGPASYLDGLSLLDENTLAVHLTVAEKKDLALLRERGVRVCLCPTSNLHLTGLLPPLGLMLGYGFRPCLGTDSPASGASLNLFNEMAILLDAGLDADQVLAMATIHGAEALHLSQDFGSIQKGARPSVLCLPCKPERGMLPLEAAIRAGAQGKAEWIVSSEGGAR